MLLVHTIALKHSFLSYLNSPTLHKLVQQYQQVVDSLTATTTVVQELYRSSSVSWHQ